MLFLLGTFDTLGTLYLLLCHLCQLCHVIFCMRILRILRLSPLIVSIISTVSCDFLHGDLDVLGDIANIATFASAFFHPFLDHFGPKLYILLIYCLCIPYPFPVRSRSIYESSTVLILFEPFLVFLD